MIPVEDSIPPLERLTSEEEELRRTMEANMRSGLRAASEALKVICEKRLYRSTHATFEAYTQEVRKQLGWSREEKRQIAAEVLKENPQMSDRQIAAVVGVSHPTVAATREKLEESGQLESFTNSIRANGGTYPRKRESLETPMPPPVRPATTPPPPRLPKAEALTINHDLETTADRMLEFYTPGEIRALIRWFKIKGDITDD
jgi:hypothetical protein